MESSWYLSRRTLLRGAGAAMSLPLLDVMLGRNVRAAERAEPVTRLAYLYIPNGAPEGQWHCKEVDAGGNIRKLGNALSALQPFTDQLNVLRKFWTPRGNGHISGTATWLTGGSWNREQMDAGGTSVDQLAAQQVGNQTLLPSLDLSTRGEGMFTRDLPRNTISWVDSRTPAPRDVEPRTVFDRMFRTGSSPLASRSVIDAVMEDASGLKRRVSQSDRRKIDEYLESIRAIERRIEFAEQQQQRASKTIAPDQRPDAFARLQRPDDGIPPDHGDYVRTMLDMIVLAFWSNATRVSTFMMDHGQSNRYFNFIEGVQGTWHALSHWKDISGKTSDDDGVTSWSSREEKRAMYQRVVSWHSEQVAYFLGRLRRIEEPNGTLLDNSMIVYGSSLSDGHEHDYHDLPVVLAGGGGNTIRGGRVIGQSRRTSMSDLHLAMLQRLGIEQTGFAESQSPLELS